MSDLCKRAGERESEGRFQEALAEYECLIAAGFGGPEALIRISALYRSLGQANAAMAHLEAASKPHLPLFSGEPLAH